MPNGTASPSSRPTLEQRAEALAVVVSTLRRASDSGAENIRVVFNAAAFLLLFDLDLARFTEDLRSATDHPRREFLAKYDALLLYEASEDLTQILGKDFRRAAGVLGFPEGLMKELNEVSSDLHRFWQEHQEFLGPIRKSVAAHREHDALAYIGVAEAVEPLEVMRIAAEFSVPVRRLAEVLASMINLIDAPVTMADMLRAIDKRESRAREGSE